MPYLDWASTAVPTIHVSDYTFNWFNPNSQYSINECEDFMECEERVKKALGVKTGKVIFGGNASWFFEKLYNIQSNFWLCSPFEHDCIYKNGLETKDLDKAYLNNEIYCHQLVNNITGEIFPVDEIGKKVKGHGGYFVCDATAGVGKAEIFPNLDNWCDALVLSSHKLGVDNKQCGCSWISDDFFKCLNLNGTVVNGYGLVDGTPDLACALATAEAIEDACRNESNNNEHYSRLAYQLAIDLFGTDIKHDYIITKYFTNAINAVALPGINADALCQYLAAVHNVYVSPGHSACEENSDYRILKQYGLNQEECESTIRVSFGPTTDIEDIDALVNGIVEFKKVYLND